MLTEWPLMLTGAAPDADGAAPDADGAAPVADGVAPEYT